jgi:hypothetical protein
MAAVVTRPDYLRWTIAWIGGGSIALGVALIVVPSWVTHGHAFTFLHQLPIPAWGGIWIGAGLLSLLAAAVAWRFVLGPLAIVVLLMLFWAAMQTRAALYEHGAGTIGALVWVWFAGTLYFAAIRAARTPDIEHQ